MTVPSAGDPLSVALEAYPAPLRTVITTLLSASTEIATLCRRDLTHKVATQNVFGDEQLAVDVAADKVLMEALRASAVVRVASSEETPREVLMTEDAPYAVAFDPLDGSSIVGCNWAVGTIAGVWQGGKLVGAGGADMVAAMVTVYGPRTTAFVGGEGGVAELVLAGEDWEVVAMRKGMGEVKVFAPGNLRCSRELPGYRNLVDFYMKEGYTLRYSGGMVPDVTQLVVKGGGVFVSPASQGAPAKLRLLYEVMPMAFLVECAGGASSDGSGGVLRRVVQSCDERTAVCLGSGEEVARFERVCAKE